jgi:hypothetical protein
MELMYRGQSFNYTPVSLEVSPGKVGGKYRGMDWRFRHLTEAPVLQTNLDLFYRGQSTAVEATTSVEATHPVQAPSQMPSVEGLSRSLLMKHQRLIKNRQQSLLQRSAAEVGLDADITTYWNRIQGKIHPTFRMNYDRVPVTMS